MAEPHIFFCEHAAHFPTDDASIVGVTLSAAVLDEHGQRIEAMVQLRLTHGCIAELRKIFREHNGGSPVPPAPRAS